MTKSIATIAPYREALRWSLRYFLGGLAIAGLAASLNISTAQAADTLIAVPAFGHAPNSHSWGAGPVMVSLLAVARQERPIAGIEPAALRSGDFRPTSLPLPVREPGPVTLVYYAQQQPLSSGGSLKLTTVSFAPSFHR